jgi:glucosamine--fructose-6-phosphate aminotransferase (isomerizing)
MPRDVTSYRLYEQISSQPAEIERILSAPEPIDRAAELLSNAARVFTVGTGTSTNAAVTAAWMLRAAGLDAIAWSAFDFALYPPAFRPGDAAIVFSHSGRKQYSRQSLERLRDAAVPTIWVASPAAEPNDATVILHTVPRETSSAFTVSHTTAMLLTARLADHLRPGSVGDITAVPSAVREAILTEPHAAAFARIIHGFQALFGIAGGPHEPSAHEIAIKINEAPRLRARGYAVEQFLHGPQAQLQPGDPVVVFAGPGAALERSHIAAQFGVDVGSPVAWIAPLPGPDGAVWISVPDVGELLAPIVEIIPAQWLAAHLAALQDVDGDNFRRDDPVFLNAYNRYSL